MILLKQIKAPSKLPGIRFAVQRTAGYFPPQAVTKCTCRHVHLARCLRENKTAKSAIITAFSLL